MLLALFGLLVVVVVVRVVADEIELELFPPTAAAVLLATLGAAVLFCKFPLLSISAGRVITG